jgi:hypothetical protein
MVPTLSMVMNCSDHWVFPEPGRYRTLKQPWQPPGAQLMPTQFLLTQSLLPVHVFPLAQVDPHEPPQSTSLSLPFLTRSSHDVAAQRCAAAGQ